MATIYQKTAVAPTIVFYLGVGLFTLAIVTNNGWLGLIGFLMVAPWFFTVLSNITVTSIVSSNMRRHPELYETHITENEDGDIINIRWKKVR